MSPEEHDILVIEPDSDRRWLIECTLTEEGFPVTAVAEGFSAIRAANRRRYALAIVAAILPGSLDGALTVRYLRRRQPSLKALLTAGAAESRPTDPDSDGVIAVPFRRHELLGCVFELLQRLQLAGSDRCRSRR